MDALACWAYLRPLRVAERAERRRAKERLRLGAGGAGKGGGEGGQAPTSALLSSGRSKAEQKRETRGLSRLPHRLAKASVTSSTAVTVLL